MSRTIRIAWWEMKTLTCVPKVLEVTVHDRYSLPPLLIFVPHSHQLVRLKGVVIEHQSIEAKVHDYFISFVKV